MRSSPHTAGTKLSLLTAPSVGFPTNVVQLELPCYSSTTNRIARPIRIPRGSKYLCSLLAPLERIIFPLKELARAFASTFPVLLGYPLEVMGGPCQNISLYEPEQSLSLSQDEGEQC